MCILLILLENFGSFMFHLALLRMLFIRYDLFWRSAALPFCLHPDDGWNHILRNWKHFYGHFYAFATDSSTHEIQLVKNEKLTIV